MRANLQCGARHGLSSQYLLRVIPSFQGTTSFRTSWHRAGGADNAEENPRLREAQGHVVGAQEQGVREGNQREVASPPGLQTWGDRISKICRAPGLPSWGQSGPRALTVSPGARRAVCLVTSLEGDTTNSIHPPVPYLPPRALLSASPAAAISPRREKLSSQLPADS